MKAAFVGLVGRPSCGKSTLINRICGHKVSIISPVPQTTRNRVRGIYSGEPGQLVFVDTPGFHLSDKKINLHLKELATMTLSEVEIVLYLIDVTRAPGDEERALIELLRSYENKLIVALNKIDIAEGHVEEVRTELSASLNQAPVHIVSALTGQGVEALLETIWERAPEGERMYPEDYYTDQSPEFRIAEIIREKAILQTRQEVPHSLFVDISDMEMKEGDRYLWVRGFIYVERESQKGIVVGKGGEKIKTIVRSAEQECNHLFPYRVKLDIRVKTRPKWRKDEGLLKKLIN
ncbi:MAG: GTPase Era [Spirochaetaceae bacterium]|nr:MAG: GTPase Era [Spirochaetaceae bacterium]